MESNSAIVQGKPTAAPGEGVMDDRPLWSLWETAKEAWLESKRRRSGSENTVQTYETACRQFFEWAPVAPWQVSAELAQEWAAHLAEEGLSKASIALKLAALSSFYEFVQCQYIFRTPDDPHFALWPAERRNPFDAVERPKVSPYGRARFPNIKEVLTTMEAINRKSLTGKRDFALLYTLLVTCRRSSEVLNLKWGDLRELEDGHYAFTYRCNGGKKQAVLNRRCYQAICAYLRADGRPPEEMQPDDYIFVPMYPERVKRLHPDLEVDPNQPISNSLANRILKKYARRTGMDLEKAHLHGLRHAGARLRVEQSKASRGDVDYMEMMRLLGHSSLAVTQTYGQQVLEDPGGDAAAEALWPKGSRRKKEHTASPEAQTRRKFAA